MSLKENLNEFWENLKESYYRLEERIGFPPILILLALLILGAFLFLFDFDENGEVEEKVLLSLRLVDERNAAVPSLDVEFTVDGEKSRKRTDSQGRVSLQVKPNSSVRVFVESELYESEERTFFVGDSDRQETLSLKLREKPLEIARIIFEDEKGRIRGRNITARIRCENTAIPSWQETDRTGTGLIETTLPLNCGGIIVSADLDGYKPKEVASAEKREVLVLLERIEVPKGKMIVRVTDSETLVLDKDLQVTIEFEGERQHAFTRGYGIAEFEELLPGIYSINASDPEGRFASGNGSVEVIANQTAEAVIELEREIRAGLLVRVLDMETGSALQNAIVKIFDFSGELSEARTQENGIARFSLHDFGEYSVVAKKETETGLGYFPSEKDVNVMTATASVTMELERITEEKAGSTTVIVLDEDSEPVKDARVMFKYKDTESIVELGTEKNYVLSDANGKAEFNLGNITREIFPYAFKYPAFGGSPEQARIIAVDEENYFEVRIEIGTSLLEIRSEDSDGQLLPGSYFEVFSPDNNSLSDGKLFMAEGTYLYELKAGRKVFVVVSSEGYADYQSKSIDLWPDESYEINAVMRLEGELVQPEIEFIGVFEHGEEAEVLKAGNEYEFRFLAEFPSYAGTERTGFHFRAGGIGNVADDYAFIKEIKAHADSINKGSSFNPRPAPAEEEKEHETKWVLAEWIENHAGGYEVSVIVRVRENIFPGSRLEFCYRGYAKIDSQWMRDPLDSELMEAEHTASKAGLYAECREIVFIEGSQPLCEEHYCITGQWLYDTQRDLFAREPFRPLVYGDYNFIFRIMNNSPIDADSLRLELSNKTAGRESQAIEIKKAVIELEEKEIFESEQNKIVAEIEGFSFGKEAELNVLFEPREETTTSIALELIEDREIVLEKEFEFMVISRDSLNLSVEPKEFIPFKKETVKVSVTDSENMPVRDALVSLKREAPDGAREILQKFTGVDGKAIFMLQETFPLTEITLKAEKIGYKSAFFETKVGSSVAGVSPESVRINLNTQSKEEENIPLSIENYAGTTLVIKSIGFKGNFKGLLDEKVMNANARMHAGKKIAAGESFDLALKAILSSNAVRLMQKHETVTGSIEFVLLAGVYGEYSLIVPMETDISLGDLPDNAPCVSVSGPEIPNWKVTATNNIARTEFEISNNCVKEGRTIELENLMARVEWGEESKKAGVIELSVTGPDGSTANRVMRHDRWETLFSEFKSTDFGTYNAMVTFTPGEGFVGETASFKIHFDGQVKTDEGLKFVGSRTPLNASILIMDLSECLRIPKEKLVIGAMESEVIFSLDANLCNKDVTVTICKQNARCTDVAGAGVLIRPERDVRLSRIQPRQSVTVQREIIPGQYGITVHAKTADTDFELVGIIDLVVEPEQHKYFSLSRYEANLSNATNWQDSVIIENKMLTEDINITAKYCTSCRNPNRMPDYCVMNKALEESAEKMRGPLTLEAIGWSGGSALAVGVACAEMGFPPDVCAIAAAGTFVVLLAGQMLFHYFGPACETEYLSFPFTDYVINLPDDFKEVSLRNVPFSVSYSKESEKIYAENKQFVQLEFLNQERTESSKPSYGILEVKAKEHMHNDPAHLNARMNRDNADFSMFNVPSTEIKEYSQKFHLKFNSKDDFAEKMIAVDGAQTCVMGTKTGLTGEKVVPKIKLDWSWDAIEWDSCDAGNPNGIYCDATQFSIALSKRLQLLNEFFELNNLACPKNPVEGAVEEMVEEINKRSRQEIKSGKVGVSRVESSLSKANESITVKAFVENKTQESVTAKTSISLRKGSAYFEECEKEVSVSVGETGVVECEFTGLEKDSMQPYQASAIVTESSEGQAVENAVVFAVLFKEDSECWLGFSTKKIEGRPAIMYFVDRSIPEWGSQITVEELRWPAGWKGGSVQEKVDFLNELIEFDALLIKDGYGEAMKKDFAEHYSTQTFFEVPSWFIQRDGLQAYFSGQRLSFEIAGADNVLPGPGTYKVFLEIDFRERFDFFEGGEPSANARIRLSKKSDPKHDSLFYHWPMNGLVGLEKGRSGYGTGYSGDSIAISEYANRLISTQGNAGNALVNVLVEKEQGLDYLQFNPQSRGSILRADLAQNEINLVFAPSVATQVIMMVSGEEGKHVEAMYSLLEGNEAVTGTGSIAYWSAVNDCTGFDGQRLREFSYVPDEEFQRGVYGLDWSNSRHTGNIYLHSVFFSPVNKALTLNTVSRNISFITPERRHVPSVEIRGDGVDSIKALLELVAEERVCVSGHGNRLEFWWNPKPLIESDAFKALEKAGCENNS